MVSAEAVGVGSVAIEVARAGVIAVNVAGAAGRGGYAGGIVGGVGGVAAGGIVFQCGWSCWPYCCCSCWQS